MPKATHTKIRRNTLLIGLALLAALALLVSCIARQDRPAPAPPTEIQATPVEAEGARFQAMAYANRELAEAAFGFDIRGAGLLPLRIRIDNRGGGALKILPTQTFLIDQDGQAWPLLTSAQASKRLDRAGYLEQSPPHLPNLDGLDALTGFAIDVAVGIQTEPEKRGKLARNPAIPAGQAASGLLFFPGADEARGTRSLRLGYEQDGRPKFLRLPL